MQRQTVKLFRQKKKNTQIGILMGQNINIFSQLSAAYLKTKPNPTQQELDFIRETRIIEYHNPQVNRLISLLRKKAQVTKLKAANQLMEQVKAMPAEEVELFVSTYAQLYSDIVLNEDSKSIITIFDQMAIHLLTEHKIIALKQIQTLYPSLLWSLGVPTTKDLLFKRDSAQQAHRSLTLLLRPEVSKRFLTICSILLQSDDIGRASQPQTHRCISALAKALVALFDTTQSIPLEESQAALQKFVVDFSRLLEGKTVQTLIKMGGKPKACLIQLFSLIVHLGSKNQNWPIKWQQYAKAIVNVFVDKDYVVQHKLWSSVHQRTLQAIQLVNKMGVIYPKLEEKLIGALEVGGFAMLKGLSKLISLFPCMNLLQEDLFKVAVNKIAFMKKFCQTLLEGKDECECRVECYAQCVIYFTRSLRLYKQQPQPDEKKTKEIQTLCRNAETDFIEHLQTKYYSEQTHSRNSVGYFIPKHFRRLLTDIVPIPDYEFKFNPILSFKLYESLAQSASLAAIHQQLIACCTANPQLELKYLEMVGRHAFKVDMTETNPLHSLAAKRYILSHNSPQQWFTPEQDPFKKIILYDPRITETNLDDETLQSLSRSLDFNPSPLANFQMYDRPQFDQCKFNWFLQCLQSPQTILEAKLMAPYTAERILTRSPARANQLLKQVKDQYLQLQQGTWRLITHEVSRLQLIAELVAASIEQQKGLTHLESQNVAPFLNSLCQYARLLHAVRLDTQATTVLSFGNKLLSYDSIGDYLLKSTTIAIHNVCLNSCRKQPVQTSEKLQATQQRRLQRTKSFISLLLDNCVRRANSQVYFSLFLSVCQVINQSVEAERRPDLWVIGAQILSTASHNQLATVAIKLVESTSLANTFGLTLGLQQLPFLRAYPQERQTLIELQKQLVQQASQMNVSFLVGLLRSLTATALSQLSFVFLYSAQQVLAAALKLPQSREKKLLDQLGDACFLSHLPTIVKSQDSTAIKGIILRQLVTGLPCSDIPSIVNYAVGLNQKIVNVQPQQACKVDQIVIWTLLVKLLDIGAIPSSPNYEKQTKLFQILLQQSMVALSSDLTNIVTFDLGSLLLSRSSLTIEHQSKLLALLLTVHHSSDRLRIWRQTQRFKISIRLLRHLEPAKKTLLFEAMIKEALLEMEAYQKVLADMEEQQEIQTVSTSNHAVKNLFIEVSELVLNYTTFLPQVQSFPEEIMLRLLQSPFQGLKKAAFVALKQAYSLSKVPYQPPQIIWEILQARQNSKIQLNLIAAQRLSSYLFTWQALLARRTVSEHGASDDALAFSLEEQIQNRSIGDMLLTTIFLTLDEQLDFIKNEDLYQFEQGQLISSDYLLNHDELAGFKRKTCGLLLKTLFLFTSNLPVFVREFVVRHKRYRRLAERVLRSYISDAIFRQQVQEIETGQASWKGSGRLEIFVTYSSKQLFAEYNCQSLRIGLRIRMKDDYPLSPVDLEFGKELKMENSGRWLLMLQDQLQNKNTSLLSGILRWRDNVDRRLEGVQECSICMDIVNSNGHLPKMACKTCKKRFHGNCVMHWFNKSSKSECPLCKSQFL